MTSKRAWQEYRRCCALAQAGECGPVEADLRRLLSAGALEPKLESLCRNDLGVLLTVRGDIAGAREQFAQAQRLDPGNAAAAANLARIGGSPQPVATPAVAAPSPEGAPRLAILSLLFNWPSSGGGCMHTVGLGKALAADGWEVRHLFVRQPEVGVGRMEAPYPLEFEALELQPGEWRREAVAARFREAVDQFAPDGVLVTDAWNFKPHLALAMQGYAVLLRFDGQECLCPLNNARFLAGPEGSFEHCPFHQLATPEVCLQCLRNRAARTGPLHQAERSLSGVEAPGYHEALRRALWEAEAVLVNNPLFAAMLSPYAPNLRVVPPGIEAERFPWEDEGAPARESGEPARVFMAGMIEEPFKGFSVLHEACARLWRARQDFRLAVTGPQRGPVSEFCESTGWLSQEELPEQYHRADICVVPSLVQDAWPNTASEAMAAGRPVVASRTGGLQFMVSEGGTGLLFTPGDASELADCLTQLLGDPEKRKRLGRQGRQQFLHTCSWEALLARHYRPLLGGILQRRSGEPVRSVRLA